MEIPFETEYFLTPTSSQNKVIEVVTAVINITLNHWGRASGKSTLRRMLCNRIIADDNVSH